MLKKYLIGTLAVAALLIGVTAAAADFGTTTLRVGSKGEAVKAVQTLVGASPVDGIYGRITAAKVKVWQAANGLTADGVFGPASKAKAGSVTTVPTTPGTTVAGCPAGALFNSLTGAPCTSTTPSTGTVTTTGAEGSVAVSYDGAPANGLTINKGENKDVLAIKVKAQGSDMKVTRVWVDVGSRVWLSADTVTLKDGSTVLATLPLTASTVTEVTAGSAYRLEFNGLNFVVAKDTTKVLTMNVNRPTLTTNDDDWTVSAISVRAVDGAGITDTYPLAGRSVVMGDTTAATGTMTVSLNANSPLDMSVSGLSSTSGVTTNVKLMDFDVKATDGPLNVTEIVGTLTSSRATDVASLELRDGTTVLDSVTVGANTLLAANAFDFTELSVDVAKDTTKTLSVYAVVNSITATTGVTAGDSIKATVTKVYATSGPTFTSKNQTSLSVAGNTMHLFKYAPTLTLGAVSAVQADESTSTTVQKGANYSIAFTVAAPSGSDIYVDTTLVLASTGKTVDKGAAIQTTSTVSGVTSQGSTTPASDKIAAGTSRTFTITGYVPHGGSAAGFTAMSLASIPWSTTADDSDQIAQTWGLSDFKTASVYVTQ